MGVKSLPKDHPCHSVFEDIADWHNTMECVPAWEEILEIEYVRQRGELNMFSGELQRYCFDRGLYAAVNWIQRCKDAGVQYRFKLYTAAIDMFEKEHGKRETWITNDVKAEFLERELSEKERVMKIEIAELRAKRNELKKRG